MKNLKWIIPMISGVLLLSIWFAFLNTANLTFDEKLNNLFTDANVNCWKEFDETLEVYRNEISGENVISTREFTASAKVRLSNDEILQGKKTFEMNPYVFLKVNITPNISVMTVLNYHTDHLAVEWKNDSIRMKRNEQGIILPDNAAGETEFLCELKQTEKIELKVLFQKTDEIRDDILKFAEKQMIRQKLFNIFFVSMFSIITVGANIWWIFQKNIIL